MLQAALDPILQAAQARTRTKVAIAGMQRHWVDNLEDREGIGVVLAGSAVGGGRRRRCQ